MTIKIEDHPDKGHVTIEGINYAHELFTNLGKEWPIGRPMKIEKREGGTLTIVAIPDGGGLAEYVRRAREIIVTRERAWVEERLMTKGVGDAMALIRSLAVEKVEK